MRTRTALGLAAVAACITLTPCAFAQAPQAGCSGPEYAQLDFWQGTWTVNTRGADKPGGRNVVTRTHDGCVFEERFDGRPNSPLVGSSFSTFDRVSRQWKQTWVDNSGAYLDFVGGKDGETFVFARSVERGGKKMLQRMVFSNIAKDAFDWDWQRSDDEGKTWVSQWMIRYERVR